MTNTLTETEIVERALIVGVKMGNEVVPEILVELYLIVERERLASSVGREFHNRGMRLNRNSFHFCP